MFPATNGIISTEILYTNPCDAQTSRGMTETRGGASMFNILSQKRCSKCGEWKDKGEFSKQKGGKGGLRSRCKACASKEFQKYRLNNFEKLSEKRKNYYAENIDDMRARSREYRNNNLEKEREKYRKYREENLEKERERNRRYKAVNRETISDRFRKWYTENHERNLERSRAWHKSNRDRANVIHNNYMARKRNNGGTITAKEWLGLKEFYNYTCLRCGRREPEIKLTLDHVLPLSLGGKTTTENAQPLCGSCNSSKRDKHIDYRGGKFG